MTLNEKQFQLEGLTFGLGCPIGLKDGGWVPGAAALRTQDADRPTGDGVRMGKDYRGSATWSFSLFTTAATEEEAWDAVAELAGVWDADEARGESERVLPLTYQVAGKTRMVYGRPRRWTATPDNTSMVGLINIECDFDLTHHLIFDATEQSKEISIGPRLDEEAGLSVPFEPPFTTGVGASERETIIKVGGAVSTPITVEFHGPISGAKLQVGPWTAALVDPVPDDDPVTIDARPWVASATKKSGGGVRLEARETQISKMWLPKGEHNVVLTGYDPSVTSRVVISWHDAYRSPR